MHGFGGVHEVRVTSPVAVGRGKHARMFRDVEILNDFIRSGPQLLHFFAGKNIFQHKIPNLFELLQSLRHSSPFYPLCVVGLLTDDSKLGQRISAAREPKVG